MAIQDTWLANLKALVKSEGGGRKGIRAVADIAGLSEEYVYQLVADKPKKDGTPRSVGKDAANKIAEKFANGRTPNWFDLPEPNTTNLVNTPQNWRLQASLKAQATIDLMSSLADKLTDEDWALLAATAKRLALPQAATQATAPARVKPEHQEEIEKMIQAAEARRDSEQQQKKQHHRVSR